MNPFSAKDIADLGPVLCVFRAHDRHPLAGWRQAVRARQVVTLESHHLYEAIHFHDADNINCWRLYLLPDTNYWQWEINCQRLEAEDKRQSSHAFEPRDTPPCRRMSSPRWLMCHTRFHAVEYEPGSGDLALGSTDLSATGQRKVSRMSDSSVNCEPISWFSAICSGLI